jgi:hypothetical protein
VHRDYASKGVKFFFVYKSLAHPELSGNYVQPFTLAERLAHASQAEKQLGSTIPWLVDHIDNRLKHALGDRPNSEFVIDPNGTIISKSAWSYPAQVRRILEQEVGTVDRITTEDEIQLNVQLPLKAAAARGVLPRIRRPKMQPLVLKPEIDPNGPPFFAKLRAEADADLMKDGSGSLYLGFHLDPFHDAHWNNLTSPLSFKLQVPEGVVIEKLSDTAPKVSAESDTDPREFLLNVETWPVMKPIQLTVTYFACVGDTSCHAVRQTYVIHRRRDEDGGGARGEGAGYWEPAQFTKQMLQRDKDGDGKLNKTEVTGLVRPHFESLDTNADGLLDRDELKTVSHWLNSHHEPRSPSSREKQR